MGRTKQLLTAVLVAMACRSALAVTIDLQLVTGSVTSPVYVTHAGDGSGRLFIVEQGGRIKIHDGTNLLPAPFLNMANMTLFSGEQGLLSAAFHPGYSTNGHFYVYFTNLSGSSNVVARFTASPPSANTVNTNTIQTVLRIAHLNAGNHNGGPIQFGPDGYLYIATGDGGGSCDDTGAGNNAQNLGLLLGKMLRIDVNNFATNYTIPPSNPFVSSNGVLPEIWAYGLRNPWRFSFDRLAGDMFIGDVGQGTREEVSFQAASSAGGENYGWKCIEGNLTNTCSFACPGIVAVPPILDYSRSPNRAVTGGYRYRGSRIPPLVGTYVFADYFNFMSAPAPIVGATNTTSGAWNTNLLLTAAFNISSFGEDEDGELYVCRHATAGQIYRIVWKDSDGDGMPDDQEIIAGTNPTNNLSLLRITSVTTEGDDTRVTWSTAGGRTNVVQVTSDLSSYSNISPNIVITGSGDAITNYLDPDGVIQTQRFYRIGVVP